MSATAPATPMMAPARYRNGREFLDALGGIPIDRVVFDPWPGTATEQDCLEHGDRVALCEMIDNTLVEKSASYWESVVAVTLIMHLGTFVRDHDLGHINGPDAQMRVPRGNVRLPDVTFTAKARVPTRRVAVPDLCPDLIVEVLSESNTPAEIDRKLAEFFAGGTRLAWVIDPDARAVAVHRGTVGPAAVLTDADALDGEDVLPGFTMPVIDLFRGIPPA